MSFLLRRVIAGNGESVPIPRRVGRGLAVVVALASLGGCGTEPSVPTTITLNTTSLSFTALGQTQQLSPSVSDQRGDPLPTAAVSWGSSNAEVASVNSDGLVTAHSSGSAQVTATAGAATATAEVTVVQTPTQLQKVSGDAQTAIAGQTLADPLVVQVNDALGNPVSGATVIFAVSQGGGSVVSSTTTTAPDGRASTTFRTGTVAASPQSVSATIAATSTSVSFTASTTAGLPASITIAAGNNQNTLPGAPVPVPPSVLVSDANLNPVAAVAVTFEVVAGGGDITGGSAVTNASGIAQVGSWTLGSAGSNRLRATASPPDLSGNPVTFTANATTSSFNIVIRFIGNTPTASQRQAFDDAQSRWESIITGDLQNIPLTVGAGTCGPDSPAVNETVDDLLIFVTLEPIDGTGNVLGSAGPCFIRTSNNLTILGAMRFDTADLAEIEAAGLLSTVVLHEMGHVLGFGSLWGLQQLLADASLSGGTDPHFVGTQAISAFDDVGGSAYAGGSKVPVEDTGGEGAADGHWRESVFATELMTAFIDPEQNQTPLSIVTVASLADQGYSVNPAGADPYTLSLSLRAPGSRRRIDLGNDLLPGSIQKVDASGRVVGVFRR